jgi:hypothetical protein
VEVRSLTLVPYSESQFCAVINVPRFKGQERFAGKIYHSSLHTNAAGFKGKKACSLSLDSLYYMLTF